MTTKHAAREARANARLAELQLEQARWADLVERASDPLRSGRFKLLGDVDEDGVDGLVDQLHAYAALYDEPQPILLDIDSPGGEATSAFVLYDTLRHYASAGHLLTTRVRGRAASAAGLIFMAGEVRIIGAHAQVMIHQPRVDHTSGQLSDILEEAEGMQWIHDRVRDVYTSRSDVAADRFEPQAIPGEWWIDADLAVRLGIAHHIG